MTTTDLQTLDGETPGKRERAKAANRGAILDAARLVFAELGFEATTVRDIIRRTELASGTFYNYFRSKEEIHDALVRQTVTEFSRLLRTMKRDDMSFSEYLHCAFGAYFRYLARQYEEVLKLSDPHFSKVIIRVDTPEMKAMFQEIRKDIVTVLASEGYTDVDSDYLTASMVGMAREMGDCMLYRMSRGKPGDHVAEATEFAAGLTLYGVRHRPVGIDG